MKALKVTISTVAVGRTRAGREPEPGQHRPADRRQILRGEQSQRPAADLSARGPPRRPPAGLRDRAGLSACRSNRRTRSLSGIDALPPITGFVLTSRKENPLVETVLVSPKPAGEEQRHDPGRLALRAGQGGGLHHRRRRPLDQELARPAGLRQALRPDGPLGDAAGRRHGQVHHRHRSRRRAGSAWSSPPWTRTTSFSISSA